METYRPRDHANPGCVTYRPRMAQELPKAGSGGVLAWERFSIVNDVLIWMS